MTMQGHRFEKGIRRRRDDPARKHRGSAGVAPWLAAAGIAVISLVAGPAQAQTEEGGAGDLAAEVGLDAVDAYRLALLRMKGHLGVARGLVRLEAGGAAYHLGEALQTIFEEVETELEERGASLTEATLRELENAVAREPEQALPAIESAAHAIDGSFARAGAMDKGSVLGLVEALLRGAVDNYREAVSDNAVEDLRKYQTGRGLVIQAEALVRHSSPLADAPGQERLLELVTLIRQAWPGIMPPPIVFDPESVADRLDEAVAVMDEMR